MRYLTLSEVLELHRRIIAQSGGALGILNIILQVASGELQRDELADWLGAHVVKRA